MSQVIEGELSRLMAEKAVLDADALALVEKERALFREREEVLDKIRAKRREQFTAAEQIQKLEEFLRIEK